MKWVLTFIILFSSVGCARTHSFRISNNNTLVKTACQELSTKFPSNIFLPNSTEYTNETTHFWSLATILSPSCVISPENSKDVADILSILRKTQTQFAVRGQGHMPIKGAASINRGVLLVMTRMKSMQLSTDKSLASIEPGLTWGEVYDWLGSHKLFVLGGRYAPVGVPGLLLGGGISHHSGMYGWAANQVVNYEIITANSSIVQVNRSSNPDLFWALKGGSNNFGIVTRFDLKTFEEPLVFAGTISYDAPYYPQFLDAVGSYIVSGGGIEDSRSALVPALFVFPGTGVIQGNTVVFYDGNVPSPSALSNFTSIPSLSNTARIRTYPDLLTETVTYGNRSFRDSFHSLSLKATRGSLGILNETITGAALAQLKDIEGCYAGLIFQPVSKSWLMAAQASGGDALDLDPADGDFIAFNLYLRWSNAADDTFMMQFATSVLTSVQEQSNAKGLSYPFLFMNDAAAGQQILQSYGKGKSLPRLKQIRKRYDPEGVFQYLQPGGFKVGI